MAAVTGLALDMAGHYKGMRASIEVLKTLRDTRTLKSRRRTPYEGIPVSIALEDRFAFPAAPPDDCLLS